MSRTGLLRAEQALADLTIDELYEFAHRVTDVLTRRHAETSPDSDTIAFRIMRLRRHVPPPPDYGDADELETRNTQPAPPLAWDEGTR